MPNRTSRVLAGVIALLLLAGACGSKDEKVTSDTSLQSTTVSTAEPGCNTPAVAALPYHVAYAKNTGELAIYETPGAPTPKSTLAQPRLTDSEPPIEVPLVFLIKDEPVADCAWIEVYLPERPNFSTGWVKRADVKVEAHSYRIEVRLADFNLKAYEGDKVILDVPIAVADEDTPTPGGTYYTTELLKSADPTGIYGPYAYGLSGHAEGGFNGGKGQFGIHGTDQPDKIGTRVSHGCIRMLNDDITKLTEVMKNAVSGVPVIYGVPVQVFA